MKTALPISIGAGLASALLLLSTATGSSIAKLLLFLVVLPSFIAGLGWGNSAAIVAVLVASAIVTVMLGPLPGGVYLVTLGAPVIILVYLALLAREGPHEHSGAKALEWYPPGRLIAWSTVLGGIAAAMAIPALGFDAETYRNTAKGYFNDVFFGPGSDGAPAGSDKEQMDGIVDLFVLILPASSAMVWMGIVLSNLWIAQKVLEASGRAVRPTPALVTIAYPARFPLGFVASLAGTFLPGIGGIVATGFAGAFLTAYVLMGLAVCHVVARQYAFSGLILSMLYMAMLFIGWIAILVAILGLSEPLVRIRERMLGNSRPPHGPGG